MNSTIKARWGQAWNQQKNFRIKIIAGFIVLIGILSFFPFFFQFVEKRNGIYLNDPLLDVLPATDLSVPVFAIIWFTTVLTLVRAVQNPRIFIIFLYGFIFLSLSRILTIYFIPLNPPRGLIELKDPLSNTFYGKNGFVTKDLFFSGHTATQWLMFLCLQKKSDKRITLISSIAVGLMVLVQHVHYTLDVVAAPVFAWLVFKLADLFTRNSISG